LAGGVEAVYRDHGFPMPFRFFGAKSSMQMTSFSRISCVDSLCAASCRWLAICSYSTATLIRAFSPRLLPFDFRESCRWRRASFFSDSARYLWFGYETPSEVTANCNILGKTLCLISPCLKAGALRHIKERYTRDKRRVLWCSLIERNE